MREIEEILGIDELVREEARKVAKEGILKYFTVEDRGGAKWQAITSLCSQPGCRGGHSTDLVTGHKNSLKFDHDTLHIRRYPEMEIIEYHWDAYNIRTDFFSHLLFDTVANIFRGKW